MDRTETNNIHDGRQIGALNIFLHFFMRELSYYRLCLDIDTTVESVFGHQQGIRKGHNTKYRGKNM